MKKSITKYKIFWEIYGCEMNKSQAASLKDYLTKYNFEETFDINNADFVFIYTCSVRQSAEDRIFGRLGYFKYLKNTTNPFLSVVILGCLSEEYMQKFIDDDLADLVFGTKQQEKIVEYLIKNKEQGYKGVSSKKAIELNDFVFLNSSKDPEFPFRSYVTISHGCSNFCTFCIVPYLRGLEISRNSNDIIEDVKNLASIGVKEIILLGQNVNSYGKDNNDIPFYKLLEKVANIKGIELISYLSPHPKDFSDELIEITAKNEKISKMVHVPLQSGSDKILRLMNRKYTIEKYTSIIEKFKKFNNNMKFSTDIIVGFTDETEDDFKKTLEIVEKIRFTDAFMYKYSKRPLVKSKLEDNIPESIKKQRLSILIDKQNKISIEERNKEIEKTKKSIILKMSKKNKNQFLFKTFDGLFGVINNRDYRPGDIINIKLKSLSGKTFIGE